MAYMKTFPRAGTRQLVQFWVDADTADRLNALARARDRTMSAELRVALREHLVQVVHAD
jgi:predicted transcriptional regulator